VAVITRRASTITSTSLRERLPVSGNGDELDELARVFNEMLAGLRRSLEQMEAFTSDAAHQFRTPLTRVRGELDLILRDGTRRIDEVRPRLGEMSEELERLARTCSRLLLLARLDRGTIEADLLADEVDLASVVEDLHEQFQPLAAERGVRVRSHHDGETRVRCSRPLVVEALLNLLDNALRASPRGSVVEVSLRRGDGVAILTVADQGRGIPAELREQVFRRFYRHAAIPDDGGTGLGLAIVRGIARAHGGDVRVEASRWGGAALVLIFPLRPEAHAPATHRQSTLSPA
jgi:two-component system OmpR family sensor kinase